MGNPKKTVRLRKGRSGPVWAGHPWVFSGAIKEVQGNPEHGDLIHVVDPVGNGIGYGHFSKDTHIAVRMLTLGEEAPNEPELITERLQKAIDCRRSLDLPSDSTTAFRLVSSEGDRLPGLTIEQLGEGIVIAVGSPAMLRLKDTIQHVITETVKPSWMVFQVSKDSARMEHIPQQNLIVLGEEEEIIKTVVKENGLLFHVDPVGGQKTGYYADQRANHIQLSQWVKGKNVLDAYAYGGGFGLHAKAQGEAKRVVCVDSSQRAGRLIARNAAANNLEVEVVVEDAVNYLRDTAPTENFDVVIVDPPKFVRSRSHLAAGMKKYRRVNILAMQALKNDGILVTCSCSSMVSENDFFRMLTEAGAAIGKVVQIIHVGGQGPDHPFLSVCPESRYLKYVVAKIHERA